MKLKSRLSELDHHMGYNLDIVHKCSLFIYPLVLKQWVYFAAISTTSVVHTSSDNGTIVFCNPSVLNDLNQSGRCTSLPDYFMRDVPQTHPTFKAESYLPNMYSSSKNRLSYLYSTRFVGHFFYKPFGYVTPHIVKRH